MPATATSPIRAHWENPPGALPHVTLERRVRGKVRAERLGPRAMLTLEQAAAALGGRPVEHVRRAIRAGFLRARRRGTRYVVTVQACAAFLREERADGEYVRARRHEPTIPAEEVFRKLGD